ncbi:endo alpha-1,4 polygalactosaminidase [Pseudonocardia sp. WMMC193]|uniref:endo alpha-1,4 polygalactosaminidase n=1 Tax=Pseudonocardia sp. WMMC193 TaxID=2911965 RepID=UPI001F2A4928|nr:endo alpha-1,4 polygalactosaminidase [Pseudonocardia sp. WMMC193]MCF7547813.1 endo alpha-1,4 polygalactosaminidase [Pseudonocardia sp. WMMC193]
MRRRRVALAGMVAAIGVLAACATGTAAPPPATGTAVPPPAGGTWQYQLQGPVDTSVPAGTFDVDLFDTPAATVAELKAKGSTVICYLNAGASEDWRPDFAAIPADLQGAPLDDWPGERWLDVSRPEALRPFLAARFDLCREKGFDGVEPDNVDGYANDSGFALTAADQLAFNRMLADLAHERGLTVGLKNDLDQVPELVDRFDFAVNEQCAQHGECAALDPFVAQGKPVLHVEYTLPLADFCPPPPGFRSISKPLGLTAEVQPCPPAPA